jgi:hypothetical protein
VAVVTDPHLQGWRREVAALGGRLVDIESDATVVLARTGVLTGESAAAWSEADAGITAAWETFRAVDELLDQAEADPSRAHALLTAATVPEPDTQPGARPGTTDATTAMRAATAAVERATRVTSRLSAAWDDLMARNRVAETAAREAGDTSTARSAGALAELLARDPLAVSEADVAAVEALSSQAQGRSAAAQAATGRLDVDLARARSTLTTLDADLQVAASELAHAASRIAGLASGVPVPDIDALAGWLDRIATSADRDRPRAAAALGDWFAAAQARRAELEQALAPARDGMRRREQARGLWTALRAKAGARRLDERPEVVAELDTAHDLLWQAPCDLAAADAALGKLAALLEARRGGGR